MAKKGSFSKVYDKNGDYVDVEAARFDGTRTFQMQGDVSATQTWNGDSASALTLNTSIGAKKVTTDKINDKAVQTGQIDDGAVGLTQIATNAMNGTVQDNDSKLATHAAVKTYVDAQISGQGTYLGKHTVAEINAMVTDNLHNGDRVMTSDSGTINLGPGGVGFDVEAGEDLILYKSGSTVQWDSMDGNFKTKQTAVSDPTASGTGLTFIDSASQDENGEMTLSKKTVQDGTTSQKGVVQLEDSHSSTSTTKAATPNSVKEAYDLASTANSGLANKQDKPSSATENNIATFNGSKSTKDSGKSFLPSTSTWDGTSDDKVPTAKAVQARLDAKSDADKVVAIADSVYRRINEAGDGWNKLAETTFTKANTNAIGFFDVYYGQLGTAVGYMTAKFNVRVDGSGSTPMIKNVSYIKVSGQNTYSLCVVVRGLTGNVTVELWGYLPKDNISMSIVFRACTNAQSDWKFAISKSSWTFYNYSGTSTSKPVADAGNNVQVQDASEIVIQKNIASPTNNNLVAMDANGLVKDSGKKAADFEQVANKVTSVRAASSATDTAYPSEKAVATALEGKVDIANIDLDGKTTTILAEVQALAPKGIHYARFYTRGDGGAANISDKPVSGSGFLCEVLCNRFAGPTNYRYIVTCWVFTDKNPYWVYVDSTTASITWSRLNAYVPGTPTNNNLVAMDANGLVKDSGLTKSSVESAISSAGSAIQGVKVNNTTLTPDANKVVTVPLATTSADGAMSAADKTKLDNAVTKKTGLAYRGTIGSTVFKIADLAFATNNTYSNQLDFDVLYSSHPSLVATSRLVLAFTVVQNDRAYVGKLSNTIISNRGFSTIPPYKFHAYADFANGKLTLFAERVDGNYVSVEATCIAANFEGNNILDNVNVYSRVTAELPESAVAESTVYAASATESSGTAPVKVDAYGALSAVPIDSTPDASHADNLISSKGVADALSGITSNVQADWDVTSSTSDAFIKHKPQYKYYSTTSTYAKICSFPLDASGENVSGYGIDILYRRYLGEVHGRLLYKKNFKFYCEYTGDISYTNQSYSFYYVVNSNKMDVYAKRNGYTTLNVAPLTNIPKDQVDFTDFGTEVSSLPEGATEITPVWVASSASSSGTAPVKVGSYGQLTAVGMDSTPTASSTNLMTSGDIKTALDKKANLNNFRTAVGTKGLKLRFSANANLYDGVFATILNGYGGLAYRSITFGIRRQSNALPSVHRYNTEISSGDYSTGKNFSLYYGTDPSDENYKILLIVPAGSIQGLLNLSTSGTASEWSLLSETPSTDGLTQITPTEHTNVFGANKGSASVPVYVDASGAATPCTDDFVHDTEIAKMVQVATAGTAAGSSLQPVYVNTSGVATAIDYKKWISERRDSLNALPSDWYKSEGSISIPSGNTVKYVELSGLNSIGGMDLWVMCNATNSPFMIRVRFNLFRYGRSGIQILDRSGYDNANIGSIIIRTDSNADGNPTFDNVKIYFRILNSSGTFAWRCSEARTNNHFAVLTEDQYNALTSVVACSANCTRFGATSISSRHIQRGSYDVLDAGDVKSTYSSTGTDPVNGTAVASAISGKQDSLPTSGTPISTYAINISGFSNRMRGATVAGATSGTGYYKLAKFKFDNFPRTYEGALLSIITRSGNQSIEGLISVSFSEWTTADEAGDIIGNVAILGMRGTELPTSMYDMYFIKTASKEYYLYAHIKKTSVIVTVNILNVDAGVNPADVLLVPEYVGSELPTNLKNLKLPYRKMVYGTVVNGAVGSSSIPVHIDANGKATACTDDFARDSEVVTSVQKETVSSVTKLTYTKNGSKTDVLTFMDDTDAHSLWTNAKANAS